MRPTIVMLALVSVCTVSAQTPLTLVGMIDLSGVEGRIDHLAIDTGTQRLYMAALGNNSVEVLDVKSRSRVRSLPGFREPQGIAFAADARTVVIAVYNVVLVSYRLALIPDELQGRVNSVARLIAVGSNAVGMVLTGLLLQSVGPKATIVTCFVWLLVLTLVTTASPKVRHAHPLTAGPST